MQKAKKPQVRRAALFVGGLAVLGALCGGGLAANALVASPSAPVPAALQNPMYMSNAAAQACPAQQCNAQSSAERRADFPPAQPAPAGKPLLDQASAIAGSREQAENPSQQRPTLPAKAVQMTMSQADAKLGVGSDPLIAPDRPVWIVTVHGDMTTDALPGHAGIVQHVYTEVVDAPTGQTILEAVGVDALG